METKRATLVEEKRKCEHCKLEIDMEKTSIKIRTNLDGSTTDTVCTTATRCSCCRKPWYCNETCRDENWNFKHMAFCQGKTIADEQEQYVHVQGSQEQQGQHAPAIDIKAFQTEDMVKIGLDLAKLTRRNSIESRIMCLFAGLHDLSARQGAVQLVPMIVSHPFGCDLDAYAPRAYVEQMQNKANAKKTKQQIAAALAEPVDNRPTTIWKLLMLVWLETMSDLPPLEQDDEDEETTMSKPPRSFESLIEKDYSPSSWCDVPVVEYLLSKMPQCEWQEIQAPVHRPTSLLFLAAQAGRWDMVYRLWKMDHKILEARWWMRFNRMERSLTLFDVAWSLEKNENNKTEAKANRTKIKHRNVMPAVRHALLAEYIQTILIRQAVTRQLTEFLGPPALSSSENLNKWRWPVLEYAISLEDVPMVRMWLNTPRLCKTCFDYEYFLALDWACCSFRRVDIIKRLVELKTRFQNDTRRIKTTIKEEPIPGTNLKQHSISIEPVGDDDELGQFRTPQPGHTPPFKNSWPNFDKVGGGFSGRAVDRILFSAGHASLTEWPAENTSAQLFIKQIAAQGAIVSANAVKASGSVSLPFATAWWLGTQEFANVFGTLCTLSACSESDCGKLECKHQYRPATGSIERKRVDVAIESLKTPGPVKRARMVLDRKDPIIAGKHKVQNIKTETGDKQEQDAVKVASSDIPVSEAKTDASSSAKASEQDKKDTKPKTIPLNRPLESLSRMQLWSLIASYDERFSVIDQVAHLFTAALSTDDEIVAQKHNSLIHAMERFWENVQDDDDQGEEDDGQVITDVQQEAVEGEIKVVTQPSLVN